MGERERARQRVREEERDREQAQKHLNHATNRHQIQKSAKNLRGTYANLSTQTGSLKHMGALEFQNASKYGPAFLVAVYKPAHATCAYFSTRVEYDCAAYVECILGTCFVEGRFYCKYTCSD